MSKEDRQNKAGLRENLAATASRLRSWLPTYSHSMLVDIGLGILIAYASAILIFIIVGFPDQDIGKFIVESTFIFVVSLILPIFIAPFHSIDILYVLGFFVLLLGTFKLTARPYRPIILSVPIFGWHYYGAYWYFKAG